MPANGRRDLIRRLKFKYRFQGRISTALEEPIFIVTSFCPEFASQSSDPQLTNFFFPPNFLYTVTPLPCICIFKVTPFLSTGKLIVLAHARVYDLLVGTTSRLYISLHIITILLQAIKTFAKFPGVSTYISVVRNFWGGSGRTFSMQSRDYVRQHN